MITCHKLWSLHQHKSQQGFAIVSAIFLVVVLAGLGAFIANVSTHQQIGAALDVIGSKAYQAARAGTEQGLYQALNTTPSCNPSSDIGVIDTITVTVTCSVVAPTATVTEAGIGVIYSITATACNIPSGTACPGDASSPNYVERRVTVLADTTPQ